MRKFYLITFLLFIVVGVFSQPGNYWSMASNTESSILAGAVVGGGSGITSIYYNPAGISELDDNKIALSASLFHLNLSNYNNALANDHKNRYLDYQVQPNFFSFVYHPVSIPKLSFQIAVFSRGQSLTKLYDNYTAPINEIITNKKVDYSVNYSYENRYRDTWFGIGSSYILNDRWTIGTSLLFSDKVFLYNENTSVDLIPIDDTLTKVSKYLYVDRQDLYVVSFIGKIGAHFKTKRWSLGINISLPSVRIYGEGYHHREVSMIRIMTKDGLQPDFVDKETNFHLVSNFKEPLSISFGSVRSNEEKGLFIYFSTELFFPIDDYKTIDNSKITFLFDDDYEPGSSFLTYEYGANAVLNAAFGIKKILSKSVSVMAGFKTDFSSYKIKDFNREHNYGQYIRAYTDLYHLTSGVIFDYKRANVLFGVEYTFGYRKNQYQFRNFDYPGVYDTKKYYALQQYPEPIMNYMYNGLGIYFGLSFDF